MSFISKAQGKRKLDVQAPDFFSKSSPSSPKRVKSQSPFLSSQLVQSVSKNVLTNQDFHLPSPPLALENTRTSSSVLSDSSSSELLRKTNQILEKISTDGVNSHSMSCPLLFSSFNSFQQNCTCNAEIEGSVALEKGRFFEKSSIDGALNLAIESYYRGLATTTKETDMETFKQLHLNLAEALLKRDPSIGLSKSLEHYNKYVDACDKREQITCLRLMVNTFEKAIEKLEQLAREDG